MPEQLHELVDIYQMAHQQFTESTSQNHNFNLEINKAITYLQQGLNQVKNAYEFNQIIKHLTNIKYIGAKLKIRQIYFKIIQNLESFDTLNFQTEMQKTKTGLFKYIDNLNINPAIQNHLKQLIDYSKLNQIILGINGIYYDEEHPGNPPLDITNLSYRQLKHLYQLNEDTYQGYLNGDIDMLDYIEDNDRIEKQNTLRWLALLLNQLRKLNKKTDIQYRKNAHGLSKRMDINPDLSLNFNLKTELTN